MARSIRVGLNVTPIPPADVLEAGALAEALGYESLWVGEHIVVPFETASPYPHGERPPFKPDSRFLEPFGVLTALAAVTHDVRLGTCVLILPARDPFVTARAMVTTDVLSGGRLEVGVGAGWLADEFEFIGRDFGSRAARMEEMLAVFDALFTEERPEHKGENWTFPPVGFEPKPVQRPRPPILMAGVSKAAMRRTARLGDGWIGPRLDPTGAAELIAQLERERGEAPRLPITVQCAADADLDAFEALGVDRVIVAPWNRSSKWREGTEAAAERFGLTPRG